MEYNQQDESLKQAIDSFGCLSFMLETYVKLRQTGDHPNIAESVLLGAKIQAEDVARKLQNL